GGDARECAVRWKNVKTCENMTPTPADCVYRIITGKQKSTATIGASVVVPQFAKIESAFQMMYKKVNEYLSSASVSSGTVETSSMMDSEMFFDKKMARPYTTVSLWQQQVVCGGFPPFNMPRTRWT
ncbi:hypothetical protein AAVH_41978, partial [Aphelenchoides avenae]